MTITIKTPTWAGIKGAATSAVSTVKSVSNKGLDKAVAFADKHPIIKVAVGSVAVVAAYVAMVSSCLLTDEEFVAKFFPENPDEGFSFIERFRNQ